MSASSPDVLRAMVDVGMLGNSYSEVNEYSDHWFLFLLILILSGRKSGKGIYVYEKGSKGQRPVCTESMNILKRFTMTPKGLESDEDIQFRMASRFVNEALLCLEEGILANPVNPSLFSSTFTLRIWFFFKEGHGRNEFLFFFLICLWWYRLKEISVLCSVSASHPWLADLSVSSTRSVLINWSPRCLNSKLCTAARSLRASCCWITAKVAKSSTRALKPHRALSLLMVTSTAGHPTYDVNAIRS